MALVELVPPVTVGVVETLAAVVEAGDGLEELDVTDNAVLSAEADVNDEAAFSVADEETVGVVVLASSCRGSGRATPAKTMLEHTKKQKRASHICGDGATRILQTARCDTGAVQQPVTPNKSPV